MSELYYPHSVATSYSSSFNSAVSGKTSQLDFQESLTLHLQWARHGLTDAFRWNIVVEAATSDPEIRSNMLKSLLLNSLSLLSIYAFDLLLHPLVRDQERWFDRNVGWFYQLFWLLPVVGVSFYLNSSWCTLIAKRTYTLQHGQRTGAPSDFSSASTSLLNTVATSAYRIIMVATSVVVGFVLGYVPVAGALMEFTFLCWVDAYYCFEFIWIARGMSLPKRIRHLEERWAYYFAFGLPSTALCMWGSSMANVAVFALLFPAYIIMAMHSRPLPLDPYNLPPPSPATYSNTGVDSHNPSPYIPVHIPIFAVVVWLNDLIIKVLSLGDRGLSRERRYDLSESMEEGEGVEPERHVRNGPRIRVGRQKID